MIIREEELLQQYQDRLEEEDLEENAKLYERKGLLCSDHSSDDDEDPQGRPISGKDFGVIDWGDDDDD